MDPVLHVLRPDPAQGEAKQGIVNLLGLNAETLDNSEQHLKCKSIAFLAERVVTHTAFSMAPISLDIPSP